MHLVLFDFDGTLTKRDSLLPFLRHVCGTRRFVFGMLAMSPVLVAYAVGIMANDRAKEIVLAHFLRGRTLESLSRQGEAFAAKGLPKLLRDDTMAALRAHQSAGDVCVLVSASLASYLAPWTRANGFEAALCSHLRADADGRADGSLEGGNCFGPVKLERVTQWLGSTRPERITAYGDSRGDLEMLAFADEAHWVGRKAHADSDSDPDSDSDSDSDVVTSKGIHR